MAREGVVRAGVAALAAVALAACSDPGSKSISSTPDASTYVFYRIGGVGARTGLWGVDPSHLTTAGLDPSGPATVVVEPTGATTIGGADVLNVGRWDASRSILDNVHAHALVYWKAIDGTTRYGLYAAATTAGAAPDVRRLSTFSAPFSGAGLVCGWWFYSDHASWDASAVLFTTGGADGNCATAADNQLMLVRLSAGPGTAPAVYGGTQPTLLSAVPSAAGGIQAWLFTRGGVNGVWVEPADWSSLATQTLTSSANVAVVASYPGKVWLSVDGNLKVYPAGGTALLDPGGVAATIPASRVTTVDEEYLYYAGYNSAGAAIMKVRLDGTAAAQQAFAPGEAITSLFASKNRLFYRRATGSFGAVQKTGGVATTVYTPATATDGVTAVAVGESLYFNNDTQRTCASVDPVGGLANYGTYDVNRGGTYAYWTYLAGPTAKFAMRPAADPEHMILVRNVTAGAAATRLTLDGVDGPTAVLSGLLGYMPSNYSSGGSGMLQPDVMVRGSGASSSTLVLGHYLGGAATDVFALDVTKPGSLSQITTTTTVGESVIGATMGMNPGTNPPPPPSCSSGGAAALPALLGVLLSPLFRRRRR